MVATIPSLAMMVVVISFNLFDRGLLDSMDPQLRRQA